MLRIWRRALLLLATVGLLAVASRAAAGAVSWDMAQLGRFDETNKKYAIVDGGVTVDLIAVGSLCPTGLGHLASGMTPVRAIVIKYNVARAADYWLHLRWNPGGSGQEQFEVICNGRSVGKSDLVDAANVPEQDIDASFKIPQAIGANELRLIHLSGDGLRFKSMFLSTSQVEQAVTPRLASVTEESYSATIGEPGLILDGDHVRLLAPKRFERAARIILPYLERGYAELYKIVGVDTKFKVIVYHLPKGFGGTSECIIEYNYDNLMLEKQDEWRKHRVPHLSGYLEEMAHNFVAAAQCQFGWEMVGWNLGAKVSEKVAGNPILTGQIADTRKGQADTFRRYKAAGNLFPADLPPNQVDRIHAYLLRQCELKYGSGFWTDFFTELREHRAELFDPTRAAGGDDALRNERYRVSVECFARMRGLEFKKLLRNNGVSTEVAIQSLHPTKPGWNRRLE